MNELVFDVMQEADGGYYAERLTENIFTQAGRGSFGRVKLPRDLSGQQLADILCRQGRYVRVQQLLSRRQNRPMGEGCA